ncbi:hypothetical protein [Actinomadura verrucosospora]|uniref:hypothetical protein n=1 Tax=Actinomadura verrucosospora TaxID=46165 RepID=UPI001562EE6A|nr:hypothetical protein [Actinomadura verrucosospora]
MVSLFDARTFRVHKGSVTDEHGRPLASVREQGRTGWRGALDAVGPGSAAGFERSVDVLDPWGRPLLTVSRASSHVRKPVTHVLRPDGAQLGTVAIASRKGRPYYPFHDPYGNLVGEMRTVSPRTGKPRTKLRAVAGALQTFVGGTFDINDRLGTVYGRVDPDDPWLATEDDPRTITFDPGMPQPLRVLGLASAVCLAVVRGHGS